MANSFNITASLWEEFISLMFSTGDINVPIDFHSRCVGIALMLDNDITGIISSLVDYSINSATEAKFKVECSDEPLENLLNSWLEQLNIYVDGAPTGLQELAKEYYKERWAGSSLCLLRTAEWKEIKIGNNSIKVPMKLYFVNGSSVYVKRPKTTNYRLGSDKYYLDAKMDNEIGSGDEKIVIQKPFNRWFAQYATPYLIHKGVYKNFLAVQVLQSKGDEVISKVLPYLFTIMKGSDALLQKGIAYSDDELLELNNKFKEAIKRYKAEKGKVPSAAITYDQKHEHIIPDISNMVKEELYRQSYRNILAGLGFIDMLEISPSRQESRLNPKAFVAEINAGISDFKSILKEVIYEIITRNKEDHRKFFSENKTLKIVNSPIKVNVENILEFLNRGFIYGIVSIESYQEMLGIDPDKELERMKKEWENKLREQFYPHIIQNQEDKGIDTNISAPPITKKQIEKDNEKQKAELQIEYATLVACKECGHEFILEDEPEAGMGYVKCSMCGNSVTQKDAKEEAIIDVTKNYIRIRQREPGEFEKDSFRIITLSKDRGIKAVIGRLKGEKTTTVQSYLFQKDNEKQKAELIEDLEIAPYKNVEELLKKHPYMKKYPKGALEVFIQVFNESLPKGEDYAFPVAYTAMKRWLKKHGYKKVGDKWVKSSQEEIISDEIQKKKNKLLDKLLETENEDI